MKRGMCTGATHVELLKGYETRQETVSTATRSELFYIVIIEKIRFTTKQQTMPTEPISV